MKGLPQDGGLFYEKKYLSAKGGLAESLKFYLTFVCNLLKK